MIGAQDDPHNQMISQGGRSARRRWAALAVIFAIAFSGALLGQMSIVRDDAAHPVPPGPLSLHTN